MPSLFLEQDGGVVVLQFHSTHRGLDRMVDIFQTFSNVFSSMKRFEFQLNFHLVWT